MERVVLVISCLMCFLLTAATICILTFCFCFQLLYQKLEVVLAVSRAGCCVHQRLCDLGSLQE